MWVRISKTFVYCILLIVMDLLPIQCHLPSYISTPSSKVDQYCELSDGCAHDTIPVCGSMGDKKRAFLDLCDMFEYVCDTNQIYTHIDDEDGCPTPRKDG